MLFPKINQFYLLSLLYFDSSFFHSHSLSLFFLYFFLFFPLSFPLSLPLSHLIFLISSISLTLSYLYISFSFSLSLFIDILNPKQFKSKIFKAYRLYIIQEFIKKKLFMDPSVFKKLRR